MEAYSDRYSNWRRKYIEFEQSLEEFRTRPTEQLIQARSELALLEVANKLRGEPPSPVLSFLNNLVRDAALKSMEKTP